VAKSAGTSGGASTYEFSSLKQDFTDALNPNGTLKSQLDAYPGGRENQLDFVWDGENPLEELVGATISSSTPVTSTMMQKIVGGSSVSINNAVYMPPWEDLL
jgi:hypothetical protein